MKPEEADGSNRGLTKSGVAVVVGSLVMLLAAFPAFSLIRGLTAMRLGGASVAATMPGGADAYITYSRSGKDVTATLTVVNRDSKPLAGIEVNRLEIGPHKLVAGSMPVPVLGPGKTFQKHYVLKGQKKGALDENLDVKWGVSGGTYSGGSSSSSTAMIP